MRMAGAQSSPGGVDDVKRPATLWVGGCAVGEAGGLEASTALSAAVSQGVLAGPTLLWTPVGGAFEGLMLAVCQWAVLRRLGAAPRFLPFVLATLAAAAFVYMVADAARIALAQGWPALAASIAAGALAGAFVGATQAIALAKRGVKPLRWIVLMALGWGLAAGAGAAVWPLFDTAGVPAAAISGLAVGLVGGLALGAATVPAMRELAR